MQLQTAASQLESLGNPTRLEIFRVLIGIGPEGIPVGGIRRRLKIPASTLSHHIAKLVAAGLVVQKRESRTLYCVADYNSMNRLMGFLLKNCCQESPR
jgi:DNA-binding transcriptional ArsR family regulator